MRSSRQFYGYLLLFIGAFTNSITAQRVDSIINKYGIPSSVKPAVVKPIANLAFYLAKPAPGKSWKSGDLSFCKKLNDEWAIIRFSSSFNFEPDLFSYLVESNNEWKLSAALKDYPPKTDLRVRVSYLDANFQLPVQFSGFCLLEKNYPDYRTADLRVKDLKSLELLAALPTIISMEKRPVNPSTEQAVESLDLSLNKINAVHAMFPEITGPGTTVSVKENLFDTTDIDWKNRYFLTAFGSGKVENHAGVMASIIGGSGNSHSTGKGVAWQSTLTSASFENLMPEPTAYYSQNKIDVQNHSYGTGIENEYGADGAAYDAITWQQPTLLHVFSSGNSGLSSPPSGIYQGLTGWANLTGSFKMSKNSISVGAADSFLQAMPQSSGGPAYDGRIKPELIAFGAEGTSGAAAITSGSALLLQQQIARQLGTKASAALLKVLLVCGADDVGNPGPDYRTGYGNLNLKRSIGIAQQGFFRVGIFSPNDGVTEYTLEIPENTRQLRATLVWTDTAAPALSNRALVNDLDLTLVGPDNQIHLPWVLSHAPHIDSLKKAAIQKPDHLNNLEQVDIFDPAPGLYKIKVSPFHINSSKQPFALAYNIEAADQFSFSYPLKKDFHQTGQSQIIRWQSSFSAQIRGSLTYKPVGSSIWQNIGENILLNQQWFSWQPPQNLAFYQLRISVGSQHFLSDTLLSMQAPNLQVGYQCTDSILFYWNSLPGIGSYQLYTLGDTLMEPIVRTSENFATFGYNQVPNRYVAVSPVIPNQGEGSRSFALDFENSNTGCYIRNFLVDLLDDSVRLQWAFGTLFQMERFQVEKLQAGTYSALVTYPANTTVSEYWDSQLLQGANSYRLHIWLTNGREIFSEPQTIFYTLKLPFLVFPNPVPRGNQVQIINNYEEGDLEVEILDVLGRKWGRYLLPFRENNVNISALPAGVYMLLFFGEEKKIGQSRLVIAGR